MNLLAATAVLAVAAPGWASLLGLAWGRSRASSVTIGVLGAAIALVAAIGEAVATWSGADSSASVRLLGSAEIGPFVVQLTVRADPLSGLIAVAVALVALCVQVYSAGYLADRYRPYAATVSLFTAAMMLVVHVDDLALLLIGWEVMSICSYLLIGHHSERQAARAAAFKAFLVTQVGDVGFLLGVVALMAGARTSSLTGLVAAAESGALPAGTATVGSLLLLAGVVGKSAQFPLHTWLPDAMEGPTPISALIHAATMVAAGVFVVARLYPLFAAAPVTLAVLGLLAAVTMLGAALAASAQDDLKRLLAWSTISQVALMLSALAVGSTGEATGHGRPAALAHLLSHAGFKALLFLAAGCVTHLVGSTLLRDMGGLRHRAPLVAWTFGIGLAALAGLPPTSGFVSKESVLGAAEAAALHPGTSSGLSVAVAWVVLVAGLATTVVTAFYATRAFGVVVLGPPSDAEAAHPSIPRTLTWPLVLLAVPSLALGVLFWARPAVLSGFEVAWVTVAIGTVLAVAGVAAAWMASRASLTGDPADVLPASVRSLLAQGYRADEAQARLVVRPVQRLAQLVATGDDDVVDAYVRGSATGSAWAGRLLRHVQTGAVSGYLTWAVGAAVLLGIGVAAW